MNNDLQNTLLLLETTLLLAESPEYIEVMENYGTIHILLSKTKYRNIPLHERILRISDLLKFEHMDIMKSWPILIECYSDLELNDLFLMYKDRHAF